MHRVLVGVASCLVLLASAPLTMAAPGWSEPQRLSAVPNDQGGTAATDQAADGAGNVHVAYAQCGEPMGAFSTGCSLQLSSRSATTGDWAAPVTITPVVGYVDGPAAVDVEANAAGDVVVAWQTCGYGGDNCAPQLALRPHGNDDWTAPANLVPGDLTHDNDWNAAPDVALAPDGSFTVVWNRSHRHESSSVSTVEVLARAGAVADPGVENPVLTFGPVETVGPASGSTDRTAAPVITTTDDGTTVAAWWYRSGGACHLIRYAVRPAAGTWLPQNAIGGGGCDTASTFMTPDYALATVGDEAVLIYAATPTDETGATTGDAGTWATTIDAAGAVGPTTKLSDRLFGLTSDPTSGSDDLTRAQFGTNAGGKLVLAANEAGEPGDRPVVVVRDADGSWGPVVAADGYTPTNGGLPNPAPGVAIDDAGTVTLAWSINLAVATPEDPWAVDQAVRLAQLAPGATAFSTPLRLSGADGQATRPLLSAGPADLPIVTWRQSSPAIASGMTAIYASEPTTAPDASFTWAPELPVAGEPVTFTSTATDPDDDPATLAYAWDFDADGDFSDGSGATAVASFDAPGSYDVELRVTDDDEDVDYAMRVVVVAAPEPRDGPTADFGWTPTAPQTGDTITFSSFSTEGDAPLATLAWDLDGDGAFDDATGMHAERSFAAAGPQLVGLRATDADGESDEKTATVVVQARGSAPADGGTGGGSQAGGGDTGGDNPPPAQPMTVPPPMPSGFVVRSTVDTNGVRPMPAVAGRALDDARDRVTAALQYTDVKAVRTTSAASKLGKRPGGGMWKIGEVVAQSPAAGARVPGSAAAPTVVTLTYWAGAKSDKDRCDDLRATVKGDQLDLALAQLKAAGCGTPDLKVKASKKADDPTVKSLSKDHDDLTVNVPTDQAKLDIVIWKNTGFLGTSDPGPVPSANGDLQLTAGQRNVAGIIVKDRAGRALNRASVTWDLSGAGGGEVTSKSIESGVAPVKLTPQKAGLMRVLVQWSDASGDSIYGYTEFKVVNRAKEPGFITAIGQSFKRSGSGAAAVFRPGAFTGGKAQRAGIAEFWGALAQAIRSWGGPIASAVNATAEGILGVSKTFGTSVAQLWRGPVNGPPTAASARFTNAGIWMVQPNGVVAAGGANVVAAGGMNVIAAGGGNVVAAGGMNVIAAGGGNVVAAGGGNLITLPDGAKVVAAGGANVVAAGGMNVIAAGGGN